MKIRWKDHVRFAPDKMARVSLSSTDRTQLDLYCVAPGQSQKAHTHEAQDKIYYVLEGTGRFTLAGREMTLEAGETLVVAAGVEHGLLNDGPHPLLVLVVVAPPPPHGPGASR
ncbi:MAG TPA: cupin domain-containing protein [Methylomirabilota bacterium]|nr:cupin domain-containing protein [Methylomirabilota bacterium]